MTPDDVKWWLRFIEDDCKPPTYITTLAFELNCAATYEAVAETLRLLAVNEPAT